MGSHEAAKGTKKSATEGGSGKKTSLLLILSFFSADKRRSGPSWLGGFV
jgi:hypothetical protein